MADNGTTFEVEFRGTRYKQAEAGIKAYAQKFGRSLDDIVPILQTDLRWYLDAVAQAMASRHGQAWPGGTTSKTLSKRSGALTESLRDSVRVQGNTLSTVQGTIGSTLPYAAIQEFSGTIVPKKSKYLAIPLEAALDSNGLPKKSSPRDWERTFVAKSKAGNLIIFQRNGRKVIPLYVLKSRVYIPARMGLRDTIKTGLSLFTDRAMGSMLKALQK